MTHVTGAFEMGLRGAHANTGSPRQHAEPTPITPQAIAVFRKMRAHERANGGPGADGWWELNAQLANCLDLYPGMVVYEDPAWEYERAFPADIDRFHQLEHAARRRPKNGYRFKWER
jgi:hypothetical protein